MTSTPSGRTPRSPGSSPGPEPGGRRLVAIGGGSGLAVLLRGLKKRVGADISSLTAVVCVTDDGGSSGRLRREFGVLPPGDVRNCLAALADDEDLLARLFQYRFTDGFGLAGHSFGNLFLTALTGLTGDFYQAIVTAERVLSVRGRILPATLEDVRLRARGSSGRIFEGEVAVGSAGERLVRLELLPPTAAAFGPAAQAIREADLILVGPGSLYTSVLPNLLIPGIRAAVAASAAPVVLLMNLMTQPGETDGMDAVAHLEAIREAAGEDLVDAVLVHAGPLPADAVEAYALTGARPVTADPERLRELGVRLVEADLLAEGELVRHDPERLSRAALSVADL
ncbi:MAG: uridine diphosphate-N-acetylglucosamine-binding protein YvcK [Thermoanaerobaculia bacterium]|nr:uridine diphosphate-N-acetylglucosamine-binding protein YvcK [Thermoanaerobaculia bacterium]